MYLELLFKQDMINYYAIIILNYYI